LALAALVFSLFAVLIWQVHDRTTKQAVSANTGIRSLAVLPLENFSGNPDQDYLSDGMTEALIGQLSTIHGLRVISRTSAMQYKGTRKSLPAIGKELNVEAIIEGSVQRSGNKVRISVQLIRAGTDEHLWSDVFDREFQDVLALQSDVAHGITRHIERTFAASQSRSAAPPRKVSPLAYDEYLKGRFVMNKGGPNVFDEALPHFQ